MRKRNFLNDEDGFSQKDYLLLLSTSIYFVFMTIGMILSLTERTVNETYIKLLDMVDTVVITIVTGVFGINAVQELRKERPKPKEDETNPPI